jgi:S-adenosyl-L-methionine hydrolase (adenosine-forming)
MIILFTDFGLAGPYTGQVKAVLFRDAPGVPVIDLFADAPIQNPKAAAYLLAAYVDEFPEGAVFLCVVDPGVGSDRVPGILQVDGRWFVGPDNGLFEPIARRGRTVRWWEITWRPDHLSASFHGRDLFAPVAAGIARGVLPACSERPVDDMRRPDWPDELNEIVYIDGFGNSMTGIRASTIPPEVRIAIGDHPLAHAATFTDVQPGQAFWYENANGLVEIAINRGRADQILDLHVGDRVDITRL